MQGHGSLLRRAIAFAHIAAEAGGRHVLPGVGATPAAGHYMINRKGLIASPAVLTGVVIALQQVSPG